MQHIQDKDFDQLFKDRFEDAEVQPSAGLWSKINKEIAPPEKRTFPIRWMAAASVVVTLSLLLFFNRSEKIQLHGKAEVASNSKKALLPADTLLPTNEDEKDAIHNSDLAVQAIAPNPVSSSERREEQKSLIAMQPLRSQSHLIDVEPEAKPFETALPTSTELQEGEAALDLAGNADGTISPAASIKQEIAGLKEEGSEGTDLDQPVRNRIRNAGDLLNFVVDKLDKRDEKILQFETDEDDNSSLVAINIGPFKFNSRKHK
jgi:hypothetical protein